MKPRSYIILVALLLAAIFLLWPGARDSPEPAQPEAAPPPAALERAGPGASGKSPRFVDPDDIRARLLAPESSTVAVTPELPPEQNTAWQIERQEAMLKSLQRHLESSESKWQDSVDAAERQTLQGHIEILRTEFTNQQAELRRLQQLPSTDPPPAPSR